MAMVMLGGHSVWLTPISRGRVSHSDSGLNTVGGVLACPWFVNDWHSLRIMPLSMVLREFHILKVIDKVLLNLRGIFEVSARELALNDDCSIIFLSLVNKRKRNAKVCADDCSIIFLSLVNQIIRIEFKIMRLTLGVLDGIPNDLENKTEKHHQAIIYLIFSLLWYYIQSEVKSAIGRADAVCRTQDRIYVFEFKMDGSADAALRLIDDKGYLIPYKVEDGLEIAKVGVNLSTKTRTIDSRKVATG